MGPATPQVHPGPQDGGTQWVFHPGGAGQLLCLCILGFLYLSAWWHYRFPPEEVEDE